MKSLVSLLHSNNRNTGENTPEKIQKHNEIR